METTPKSHVFCPISLMESTLKHHLLPFLHLLILFLSIISNAYLFFHRWHPAYHLLPLSCMLLLHFLLSGGTNSTQIYLLDFSCLRPTPRYRVPTAGLLEHLSLIDSFDPDSVAFMSKVITSSGLGEETYFPPQLHYLPPRTQHHDSISEAEMLLFPVLDDLLRKTGIPATSIDILVVNCSGFCPSPSLSAMVVNRFSMRDDVRSFNLSGMGCSAGAIGVDVAAGLLRASHDCNYAVVLSTEILSTGWYAGRDHRKLLLNCFFRTGAAAVLLYRRKTAATKYKLVKLVRTQRAFDDRAYHSAIKEEDAEGITGFTIKRDLLRVAADTLRSNVVEIGASILPAHEKLRYAAMWAWRMVGGRSERGRAPDFRTAVQHYCMPSSGRGVIEEIGKGLGLGEGETEAARMAFRRFGNQSSAAMWYQLAYEEAKGKVGKGDRVWMLAMGTGSKCNSVVWECVRRLAVAEEAARGPWAGCILRYPPPPEEEEEERPGLWGHAFGPAPP